jgi:hypothetical protein
VLELIDEVRLLDDENRRRVAASDWPSGPRELR